MLETVSKIDSTENLTMMPPATIRAFRERGLTVHAWAKSHGYRPETVHKAISGVRNGPRSIEIMRRVEAFLAQPVPTLEELAERMPHSITPIHETH